MLTVSSSIKNYLKRWPALQFKRSQRISIMLVRIRNGYATTTTFSCPTNCSLRIQAAFLVPLARHPCWRGIRRLKAVLAGWTSCTTLTWIHLGVFDARTKTLKTNRSGQVFWFPSRDVIMAHPYIKNRMCFPTKQWFSVLPYWYKIQETAYCVAGGNQDHHRDRQWPFKE